MKKRIGKWVTIHGRRVFINPKGIRINIQHYKRLQSVINTYGKKFEKHDYNIQTVGDYTYIFEYYGFDKFKIVGKRKEK